MNEAYFALFSIRGRLDVLSKTVNWAGTYVYIPHGSTRFPVGYENILLATFRNF